MVPFSPILAEVMCDKRELEPEGPWDSVCQSLIGPQIITKQLSGARCWAKRVNKASRLLFLRSSRLMVCVLVSAWVGRINCSQVNKCIISDGDKYCE